MFEVPWSMKLGQVLDLLFAGITLNTFSESCPSHGREMVRY